MLPSVRNNGYLKCRVKYVLIRWMILTCVDSCVCDICVCSGESFAFANIISLYLRRFLRIRSSAGTSNMNSPEFIIAWKNVICYWQLKRFGIQKRARALQPKMRRL